jgi:hypothetical protein
MDLWCVLSSNDQVYTYLISNGVVSYVGVGDQHDSNYNSYKYDVTPLFLQHHSLYNYQITVYPTNTFYASYRTNEPLILGLSFLVVIIFTAIVIAIHNFASNRREAKLAAQNLQIELSSKNALLKSKKTYVRYISHEMR